MKSWSKATQTRPSKGTFLIVGPDSRIQRALIEEIHSLSISTETALDLGAATTRRIDPDRAFNGLILPQEEIRTRDFEEELSELRIRTGSPYVVPIAFGQVPSEQRRRALRDAGIELALFGRFGRHALRFQLNRVLSAARTGRLRRELRAPQEWRTRTFSSGKAKAVRCYSICSRGGYFVTPRPWIVGSDISLELPFGRERLLVDGRILYTNTAGTDSGQALPQGMAITFRSLSDRQRQSIRLAISETQTNLEV